MTYDHAAALDLLTRLAQALRLWAITLVGWLAEATGLREMRLLWRGELRQLRRETRELLCLRVRLSVAMGACVVRRRERTPRWRRDLAACGRRRMQRVVLGRLRVRTLAQCRAVLGDVERHVARACARLAAGYRIAWTYARPAGDATPMVVGVAPSIADSS